MALINIPAKSTGDTFTATELNTIVTAIKSIEKVPGFGNYDDDALSSVVFTTSPSKLTINSLGAQTNESYLPYEIRGVSSLWDAVTNKITPINIGDEYNLRIGFSVTSKTGNPAKIFLSLDIGGLATPTINIVEKDEPLTKNAPFNIDISFPIYALDTFKANGGQLFLSTDTGTITVGKRDIYISRISNGQR